MPKFIFFQVPATGHINPSLPIVAELVKRGAEVLYYLPEAYREKIAPTGAEFRAYPEIVERTFDGLDGTHPMLTLERLSGLSRAIFPELLKLIETEKPDGLIHDSMCGWGWLAARVTGVPSASSMALLMMTPDMVVRSGLVGPAMGYMLTSVRQVSAYFANARAIKQQYGVSLPAAPADFLNRPGGTITLSYTTPEIQPNAERLGYTFVGPIIEARSDGDFPFEQLDGRPLVYISLGTLVNDRPDFYRACLAALGDGSRQVVMVVPKHIDTGSLGDIPPNFIIRSYVPQLDLFPKTALCICHGGMNTAQEALWFGVPLVLIPQQMEQRLNAVSFAGSGAGVMIGRPLPDAPTLARAVDRVLGDPAFKQRAGQIGVSMRGAGGAKRAADAIMGLGAQRRAIPPDSGH